MTSLDASFDTAPGSRPPLALIAGPTASGKSDCAVALAHELRRRGRRGVIVNADSSQVYADLAILSARPSIAEMAEIEHRLFGAWDGADSCSAADWARAARAEIGAIHSDGGVPILVGGTGLYLRTLLDGIAPVPPIAEDIRTAVRALRVDQAYDALRAEDPERAGHLFPNDKTRIARALEVVRSTGKPLSHWQAMTAGGIGAHVTVCASILLPDRQALYERCDRRFAQMIDRGAIAEVESLLSRQLDPDLPVMRAIGVPELSGVVAGNWSLAEAIARGAQATRNYAKRQYTWLRHQPPVNWHRVEYESFDLPSLNDILFRNCGLT